MSKQLPTVEFVTAKNTITNIKKLDLPVKFGQTRLAINTNINTITDTNTNIKTYVFKISVIVL